jgi:hypothetical protein
MLNIIASVVGSVISAKLKEDLSDVERNSDKLKIVSKYVLKNSSKTIFYGGVGVLILNQVFDLGIDVNKLFQQISHLNGLLNF